MPPTERTLLDRIDQVIEVMADDPNGGGIVWDCLVLAREDLAELEDRVAALTADLERTRQAWVNGDDPMCDDVCVVACKGPCGLFTGEPYDADDIREATVDGCRYCNGTGVRHEASNPEPCIHCGKDGREATTDAG